MATTIETTINSPDVHLSGPVGAKNSPTEYKYQVGQPINQDHLTLEAASAELSIHPTGSYNGVSIHCKDRPSSIFHPGRAQNYSNVEGGSWRRVFGVNPHKPSEVSFGELATVRFLGHPDRLVLSEAIATQHTELVERRRTLDTLHSRFSPSRYLVSTGSSVEGEFSRLDRDFNQAFHGRMAFFVELGIHYGGQHAEVHLGAATTAEDGLMRVVMGNETTLAGTTTGEIAERNLPYYLSRLGEISAFFKEAQQFRQSLTYRENTLPLQDVVGRLTEFLHECWRGKFIEQQDPDDFIMGVPYHQLKWSEVLRRLPEGLVEAEVKRLTDVVEITRNEHKKVSEPQLITA